jgi:hypothetical protein
MSYLYPLAFLINSFAMPILLVILGVAGKSEVSAEIGIIHGTTLALLFAFSANARNLLLNRESNFSAPSILAFRLVLLLPLAGLAYALSMLSIPMDPLFALALLFRRCVEWLSEVHVSEKEHQHDTAFATLFFIVQALTFCGATAALLFDWPFKIAVLFAWGAVPLLQSAGFIFETLGSLRASLKGISARILPHLGSTIVAGVSVFVFRLLILKFSNKEMAGDFYTAFTLGGMVGNVFANVVAPSYVLHESRSGERRLPVLILLGIWSSVVLGLVVSGAALLGGLQQSWAGKSHLFWLASGLSMVGGGIMVFGTLLRARLLQHEGSRDVFRPDLVVNVLIVLAVPALFFSGGVEALTGHYLASALIAWMGYGIASWKEAGRIRES